MGLIFFVPFSNLFVKKVVQDLTSGGVDWQREKWQSGFASKFIRQGEKNAVKYADEIIVLSKGVQKYFMDTYGRETHFIPNGVNRAEVQDAKLITDNFGLEKDSYILFLGRLVPEKGIRYLVEAFKNVKTDKKLVIAGGSSDTDGQPDEIQQHTSEELARDCFRLFDEPDSAEMYSKIELGGTYHTGHPVLGAFLCIAGNGRGAIIRQAKDIIGTGAVEMGKLDQHLGGDIPLAGLVIGIADLCTF